jgi:hypothetical protein
MAETSRVNRGVHARFCERLEVKILRPTRRIAKNHNRLCVCFALVNLYRHRKRLAVLGAQGTGDRETAA